MNTAVLAHSGEAERSFRGEGESSSMTDAATPHGWAYAEMSDYVLQHIVTHLGMTPIGIAAEFEPRRRNLWVTDTLQWRRKPGSLSPRTCAGFSSLLFVASCLLNQLLPPVNAPSDRADPGKCQQRALCVS